MDEPGDGRREGEETRLEHPAGGVARVEGVDHDAAGAAFGEGELFVVDEATLHRECDEHAEDGDHDVPDDHLPPRYDLAGDEHVGRHARDERSDHVARGGGDGLGAVVFEQREVASQGRPLEQSKQREGHKDRGQSDANRNPGLAADVERG
jgi:hypothetical protein